MITFKQYLQESLYNSKSLTLDEAAEMVLKHCRESLAAPPIFRGSGKGDLCAWIDPSSGNRTSRNTLNYYNLILSHSDNWKDYPRRDKSVICTTDIKYTKNYGRAYRVFPYDGAKIGICSQNDLWFSFADTLKKLKLVTLAHLNSQYQDLVETITGVLKLTPHFADSDIETFMHQCEQLDEWIKEIDATRGKDLLDGLRRKELALHYFIDKSREGVGVYNAFEELLEPTKHGFKVKHIKDFNAKARGPIAQVLLGYKSNEVWTDSPCIMIAEEMWDEFYDRLKK